LKKETRKDGRTRGKKSGEGRKKLEATEDPDVGCALQKL